MSCSGYTVATRTRATIWGRAARTLKTLEMGEASLASAYHGASIACADPSFNSDPTLVATLEL